MKKRTNNGAQRTQAKIKQVARLSPFLRLDFNPLSAKPFQKSQFFVCENAKFVTRFLTIDLT